LLLEILFSFSGIASLQEFDVQCGEARIKFGRATVKKYGDEDFKGRIRVRLIAVFIS
jgi:hypothetical protein